MIQRKIATKGHSERPRLASSPRAPYALPVIRDGRRHIGIGDKRDIGNVHPHFHGGRTVQQVNLSRLETILVDLQNGSLDLRGMFLRAQEGRIGRDPIVQVGPQTTGPQLRDGGVRGAPIGDHIALFLAQSPSIGLR